MTRAIIFLLIWAATCPAQSPGEVVGTTYHELQDIGSGTNRMVLMPEGGLYVCWTKSFENPYPRHVYFNHRDLNGAWSQEMPISSDNSSGFCCIDVGPNNFAYVFYHVADGGIIHVATAGFPYYDYALPDSSLHWAKGAISESGRFHVLSTRSVDYDDDVIMYNTSTDYGERWPSWVRMDSLNTYISVLNASDNSERTAIVEGIPISEFEGQFDIGYAISEDGINWDISDWRMITDYDNESIGAFCDVDLLFDQDDYLHVIWNTMDSQEPLSNASILWHWSEETGEISQIADFGPVECDPGTWNLALCKMSLGIDEDDNLFCVWTGFSSEDASAGGYCNGDLYMSYSVDGGLDWAAPVNITDSQTPDCVPDECDSDNWATMAEKVDEDLRIFYMNDKDAGATVYYEGEATINPMLYLEVPNPTMTGIAEHSTIPRNFAYLGNYPNPFNGQTIIRFSLDVPAEIRIEIFDILGRLIEPLADGEYPAGENCVVWDAGNRPSGIYFVRVSSTEGMNYSKLSLLK